VVSSALLEKEIRKIKADELHLLAAVFGNQNKVAKVLGVSRSRVSKWIKGENPDDCNKEKLSGLTYLLTILLNHYLPPTAMKWLGGTNVFLHNARPLDLIKKNRVTEVIAAARQDIAGTYA
jgi:hypothetical protein